MDIEGRLPLTAVITRWCEVPASSASYALGDGGYR
jgi:hypothetical protein